MMTPIRRVARRTIDWLRNTDLVILLAVLVLVGGVLGFLKIADAVGAGATQKADERILRALRNPSDLSDPVGPPWVNEAGRDLTALGGVVVLFLVTTAVLGFLLLARKYHAVLLHTARTSCANRKVSPPGSGRAGPAGCRLW